MQYFAQIAPYLTNPLVLAGFVILLFFGIHRTLIRAKLIPPLSASAGKDILSTLLRYGFIVAVLIIMAGFGMEGWKVYIGRQGGVDADEVLAGLDRISKGFEDLDRRGGLVSSPSKPQEFYHNARLYELNGDYLNARRSYTDYLAFELDFVDPHLRYQALLKAQDGIEAARQRYAALRARSQNLCVRFASILLMDRRQRLAELEALLKANPDFAPARYQQSKEYSKESQGERTLSDKRLEKGYLKEFVRLDAEGKFDKFFLDKDVVAQYRADATARLKELEFIAPQVLDAPVSLSGMPSSGGWTLSFDVADEAKEILYKFPDDPSYTSTGFTSNRDSRTGLPRPIMYAQAPAREGRYEVMVKYVDLKGVTNGPYSLIFDTDEQLQRFSKQVIRSIEPVAFLYYNGQMTVSFSPVLDHRDVIKEIRYSVDDDSLSKSLPLGPASTHDPIEVPLATRYVSLKVVYADGTESPAMKAENHIVP